MRARPSDMVAITMARPIEGAEVEARRRGFKYRRRETEHYAEIDLCAACVVKPVVLAELFEKHRERHEDDGDD